MKSNCEEEATQIPPTISSRDAAERAVALTKEKGVLWESERSFSITGKNCSEAEVRDFADDAAALAD